MAGLFVGTGLLMFAMNGTEWVFSNPTIQAHSGGVPILDTRMSYTPDEAHSLFAALGPEGRRAYRMLHLLPDMLFPIGYALLFCFASAWFLVRLLPLDHRWQWLSLTPLISGLADILENLSLVVASLLFPSRVDVLVQAASVLTRIKFGLMPVGVIFLGAMLVIWFVQGRPERHVAPPTDPMKPTL